MKKPPGPRRRPVVAEEVIPFFQQVEPDRPPIVSQFTRLPRKQRFKIPSFVWPIILPFAFMFVALFVVRMSHTTRSRNISTVPTEHKMTYEEAKAEVELDKMRVQLKYQRHRDRQVKNAKFWKDLGY